MADWSQLPTDLLTLIGKTLKSQFDQLRFRSVCTSWRHSLTPPPSPRLSILPNNGISETSWGFYLSKRTILSLSSPHCPSQSWLIKIQQDNPLITHLVNPLTSSQFDLTLGDTLDFAPFQGFKLGTINQNPTQAHVDLSQLDLNFGLPELSHSTQIENSMQVGVPESGSKNDNPTQTHVNSSQIDLNLGLTEARDSTQIEFSGSSSKQENSKQVGVSKSGSENDNLAQTHVDLSQTDSILGFPKTLDLMPIRVTELGFEYILRYINYRPFASSISDAGNLYMEKVALFFDSRIGYVLLTIHVSGKLAMFKIGDKKWTIVQDFPSPYDDVVLFNGRFYAVDNTGRAVVVSLDASNSFAPVVEMVADPIFGGDKKTMVVSGGELLLVDTYLSVGPEDDAGFEEEVEFYEEFDCYMSERTVRFKVFRLDWGGKKWDEVKDLGDRMLFLGDYCTFSAPASDFDGCNGNCIIFADRTFYSSRQEEEEDGAVKGRGVGVFNLESGSIGFLGGFPGYSKMFWPPPSWVYSPSTTLEDDLNHLGI